MFSGSQFILYTLWLTSTVDKTRLFINTTSAIQKQALVEKIKSMRADIKEDLRWCVSALI